MTARRARGARRAGRPSWPPRPASTRDDDPRGRRSSATRSCTTSPRHRPGASSAARRSRSPSTAPSTATRGRARRWPLPPGARVYVLPCIAGHVGADTAGVILSERPDLTDEMTLLVDVGTNAEIVLGNRAAAARLLQPTGPAFEGAQISCGQRAAPGAIERVRIDREHAGAAVQGDRLATCGRTSPASPRPSTSTGITGICGSGIIEVIAEMFLAGVITPGRRDRRRAGGAVAARSWPSGRTFSYVARTRARRRLTHHAERRPRDPAGEGRALRRRAAADGPPGRRDASTASGSPAPSAATSTPMYAMVLGMIPDCDLSTRSRSAGNAAGTGARIALLDRGARARDRDGGRGGSRRSRPRSSRASRSTSSRRWRSRTRRRTTRTCARWWNCRRSRRRRSRPARREAAGVGDPRDRPSPYLSRLLTSPACGRGRAKRG